MSERLLYGLAWVVAAICVAPIVAAALAALAGDLETWRGLVDTVLPGYVWNTVLLVTIVAAGTAALGTGAAWLVTMYRFPGRVLLDQEITGYTLIRIGADLTSSERQALPVLADELARNATALLVDGSW